MKTFFAIAGFLRSPRVYALKRQFVFGGIERYPEIAALHFGNTHPGMGVIRHADAGYEEAIEFFASVLKKISFRDVCLLKSP